MCNKCYLPFFLEKRLLLFIVIYNNNITANKSLFQLNQIFKKTQNLIFWFV